MICPTTTEKRCACDSDRIVPLNACCRRAEFHQRSARHYTRLLGRPSGGSGESAIHYNQLASGGKLGDEYLVGQAGGCYGIRSTGSTVF